MDTALFDQLIHDALLEYTNEKPTATVAEVDHFEVEHLV